VAQEAGCAAALFRPDGDTPTDGLALGKHLALAAADQGLFDQWLEFVGLPLHR
jgi:myo-inositol-1(or 4)-monophosphatase